MKKIILTLLTIFAIQSSLKAQVAVQINDSHQNLYERKVVTFNKMKRAGIGLTIGGAVLAGVGTGLIIDYIDKYDNRYYDYDYDMEDLDMEYAIGVGLTSLGITAMGGGITLWSIGAAKSKSYKRKLDSLSFNLSPGYRQQFSLAYRF